MILIIINESQEIFTIFLYVIISICGFVDVEIKYTSQRIQRDFWVIFLDIQAIYYNF